MFIVTTPTDPKLHRSDMFFGVTGTDALASTMLKTAHVGHHITNAIAYFAIWAFVVLDVRSSGFTVLWEKPSHPAAELCFAQDGEVFAVLGQEATTVYDRSGAKLFDVPTTGPSMRHGVAFNALNRLLVWESPNTLRFLDRRAGTELGRKNFELPANNSGEDQRTVAQFSPDGAWVAYGWINSIAAEVRVANTETGSPELVIDNHSDSSIYGMRLLFNGDRSRLILHRAGLAMGDRRFSMYDLDALTVLTFPYLFECSSIAKAGNVTTITLPSQSATTCVGDNSMRDDEIYYAEFSRSGRYLGFRPGIVDLSERKVVRFDRVLWKEGSPDWPQMHLNAGEQEAFAVWDYAGWIEGFDLANTDAGPAFAFKPQWERFRWFPESITPDGKIIVLQVYENLESKLVAVENPFVRTWVKGKLGQNGGAQISWTGGQAPFRVFASESLSNPTWVKIGDTNDRLLETPADFSSRFYRIESAGR